MTIFCRCLYMIDLVIIITVANNGIGLNVTEALLNNGNHIACLDIVLNRLMELSENMRAKFDPIFLLKNTLVNITHPD